MMVGGASAAISAAVGRVKKPAGAICGEKKRVMRQNEVYHIFLGKSQTDRRFW
jgi:hypothetical protein